MEKNNPEMNNPEEFGSEVYNRLILFAEKMEMTPAQLCKEAGLSPSYLTNFAKKSVKNMRISTLEKFCNALIMNLYEFFSLDITSPQEMNEFFQGRRLVKIYRELDDEGKQLLLDKMHELVNSQESEDQEQDP